MTLFLTDKAKDRVRFFLQDRNPSDWGIRVRAQGPRDFGFSLEELAFAPPMDTVVMADEFKIIFNPALEKTLEEATIDYVETEWSRGFQVSFKEEPKTENRSLDLSDPKVIKIQNLLKEEINPAIGSHGGYAELLGLQNNVVYLKMGGGCQGCASSMVTLKHGIELRIKEEVPEITEVIDQTDHAAGANPFFRS